MQKTESFKKAYVKTNEQEKHSVITFIGNNYLAHAGKELPF